MRKLLYFVILILHLTNCKSQSRPPVDLGQGEVAIELFWFPPLDTEKMDTSGHKFLHYHYIINHDKVLKKGDIDVLNSDLEHKQIINKKDTLNSHLSSSMISPTYIINWNKKIVYTFYKKKGKDFISLDSLNKYTQDVFYRTISLGINNNIKYVFDTVKQIKVKIAGIDCYKARYKSTYNKSWRQFIYTIKQLSFYPPLNCIFNNSFPYPILGFDYENNDGNYPDRPNPTAIVRLEIIAVYEKKQQESLFLIPNDIPIKKNVPELEMYYDNK